MLAVCQADHPRPGTNSLRHTPRVSRQGWLSGWPVGAVVGVGHSQTLVTAVAGGVDR